MTFFAAEVLTLQFPTLHTQSDELTWTPATHDEELPALMVEFSTRPQCGLAYARRVDLLSRLQDEAARFREAHADPNAALQWKKEAEAHLHHVEEEDDREAGSGGGNHDGGANQAKAKKKKFIKLSEEDFEEDWYALLQCAEDATEDEIKTAYRRRCLETHPDKQASRSDELFKRVQRAFEIVGDAEIRHTYDSSRPFDESIPTGDEVLATDADYFQLYAPVFARNKKWCRDPLPSLGDGNSSHADVLSFYARWEAYHTFRDFSHLADIQEIDESMPREEKRYYQRENERELNFYKKEEQKRIRSLVERAKKADPRIRRKREEEEARRTQEEEARVAFRNQIREAEERKRADAKAREENAKREAVQKVRDEKNAMRDAQAELLAFFQENQWLDSIETNKLLETAVRRPNLVWLFSKLSSSEEARGVVKDVREAASEAATSEGVPAVLRFNAILEAKEQEVGVDRYGEPMKRKAASPTVAKSGSPTTSAAGPEWSEDDLARLTKATAKYPPGTIERWSKICVLLRGKFSEEQAMVKVNDITAALRASTAAGSATESESATATTTAPATAEETPAVEDWTMAQQRQLEQGLRELKDYKEKDKYQKIAKMVEGKTAKECFDRFKYLCSVNRKK